MDKTPTPEQKAFLEMFASCLKDGFIKIGVDTHKRYSYDDYKYYESIPHVSIYMSEDEPPFLFNCDKD